MRSVLTRSDRVLGPGASSPTGSVRAGGDSAGDAVLSDLSDLALPAEGGFDLARSRAGDLVLLSVAAFLLGWSPRYRSGPSPPSLGDLWCRSGSRAVLGRSASPLPRYRGCQPRVRGAASRPSSQCRPGVAQLCMIQFLSGSETGATHRPWRERGLEMRAPAASRSMCAEYRPRP